MIDTGARRPGEMDGGLASTLIAGGIGVELCPVCGAGHGWAGEDLLAVLDFAEPDGLTNRP